MVSIRAAKQDSAYAVSRTSIMARDTSVLLAIVIVLGAVLICKLSGWL